MNYLSQSIIGNQIFKFDEIASTNDMMRDLSEKKIANHGAIILSKFQTKGRGQLENTWESEEGKNLLFSMYLKPKSVSATEQVYINLFACLSVFDFINNKFPDRTKIKWPNDIYVDDKKIAGILIENNVLGNSIKSSIIGLGINVNQQQFSTKNATSFFLLSAKCTDLNDSLSEIISCFNLRFEQLSLQLKNKLMDDYLNVLYKKNVDALYYINNKIVEGKIIGIDLFGRLKLLVDNEVKLFSLKEISYV